MLIGIRQGKGGANWRRGAYRKTHVLPVALIGDAGVLVEAGYWRSTAAYFVSHCRLLNFTFKRVVVVVVSSTEMGRNNYESLYFIL